MLRDGDAVNYGWGRTGGGGKPGLWAGPAAAAAAPGLAGLVMRALLTEQLPRAGLGRGLGSRVLLPLLSLLGGRGGSQPRVRGSEPGVGPGQVRLSAGFGLRGVHLRLSSAAVTDVSPHPHPAEAPSPSPLPARGCPWLSDRGECLAELVAGVRGGAAQTRSPLSGISRPGRNSPGEQGAGSWCAVFLAVAEMQLVGTGWGLPIGPLCLEAPNPRLSSNNEEFRTLIPPRMKRPRAPRHRRPRPARPQGRLGGGQQLQSAHHRPGSICRWYSFLISLNPRSFLPK